MEKAGFGGRFVAWFLDGIFIGILGLVGGFILGGLVYLVGGSESDILIILTIVLSCVLALILMFIQFVYFGYFWSKSGQTIGMKLLNMKVVRRDNEPLTFIRAGLRGTVGYWISSLIFNLGFIWAAFDEDQETWHDKIFDTWVVRVE